MHVVVHVTMHVVAHISRHVLTHAITHLLDHAMISEKWCRTQGTVLLRLYKNNLPAELCVPVLHVGPWPSTWETKVSGRGTGCTGSQAHHGWYPSRFVQQCPIANARKKSEAPSRPIHAPLWRQTRSTSQALRLGQACTVLPLQRTNEAL